MISALVKRLYVSAPAAGDARLLAVEVAATIAVVVVCAAVLLIGAARFGGLTALRPLPVRQPRTGKKRQEALLAAQASIVLVFVFGASRFSRPFMRSDRDLLGFDADSITLVSVQVNDPSPREAQAQRALDLIRQRVREAPGVRSSSLASTAPFGNVVATVVLNPANGAQTMAVSTFVDSTYFKTLGIPLIAGVGFHGHGTPEVNGIVNRQLARDLFGTGNPIGACVAVEAASRCIRVTGVVPTAKVSRAFESPAPQLYLPVASARDPRINVLLLRGAPATVLPVARAQVNSVPGARITELSARTDGELAPVRQAARVFRLFASLAAILAALGLYTVAVSATMQRQREIAVRMAVGATRARIALSVLREAGLVGLVGTAFGIAASMPFARALAHTGQLPPGNPLDVLVAVVATWMALFIGVAAPAIRAAGVDPAAILRAN
jgi:hypothetical protein